MTSCQTNASRSQETLPVPRRSGAVLVTTIVCLSIATALVAAVSQSALRVRRQVGVERQLRQAEWLLEAGANLAVQRVAAAPDYQGETWTLRPDALPGLAHAKVVIEAPAVPAGEVRVLQIAVELAERQQQAGRWQRRVRRSLEIEIDRDSNDKDLSQRSGRGAGEQGRVRT